MYLKQRLVDHNNPISKYLTQPAISDEEGSKSSISRIVLLEYDFMRDSACDFIITRYFAKEEKISSSFSLITFAIERFRRVEISEAQFSGEEIS